MQVKLKSWGDGRWGIVKHPMEYSEGENNKMTGRLLAHDIVEHVNGWWNIGTVEDELQALGAMWYTRGQWGDDITDQGIVGDIISSLGYIRERILNDPGIRLDIYEIDQFEFIVEESKKRCFQDYEFYSYEQRMNTLYSLDKILGWMVIGWRKAVRKYGRYTRFTANNLFNNIKYTIDEAYGEEWYEYNLHYCIKTGEVSLVEIEYNGYN